MKKYEVRTVSIETKRGKNALETYINSTNQDSTVVKSFDTPEESREFYATVDTSVRYMSGYYLHECKFIEIANYDDDGEWIDGGDWLERDFPKYNKEADDESTL